MNWMFSFCAKLPACHQVCPSSLLVSRLQFSLAPMVRSQEDLETALHLKTAFCQTQHLRGFFAVTLNMSKRLKDVRSHLMPVQITFLNYFKIVK